MTRLEELKRACKVWLADGVAVNDDYLFLLSEIETLVLNSRLLILTA